MGKSSEERSAPGDQPDLVAIPDRPDGVEEDSSVVIALREKVQRPDPQVEAVEDRVAGEEGSHENEPERVEVELDLHAQASAGAESWLISRVVR